MLFASYGLKSTDQSRFISRPQEIVRTELRNVTIPEEITQVIINKSHNCDSALHAASEANHFEIVKLIVKTSTETLKLYCSQWLNSDYVSNQN